MKTIKPVFLFTFANDTSKSLRLEKEEEAIRNIFDELAKQGRLEAYYLSNCTVDEVYRVANRYHNRLALFHYSGHSGKNFLELKDKKALSSFLSTLLGMQKELGLVFLNGCSNAPQIIELQEKGVNNIIATTADIEDNRAIKFSKAFYKAFASDKNIEDAFLSAKALVENDEKKSFIEKRGIITKDVYENSISFPWGLYCVDNTHLNYTIPAPLPIPDNINFTAPVTLVYEDINKVLVELTSEGMSQYKEDCKLLWELYNKDSGSHLFNTLQNMMIDSFPTSLGIQLRDLFTPEGRSNGRLRLKEINETYLTLIKLITSISIADLWDTLLTPSLEPKKGYIIRESYRKEINNFISLDCESIKTFDYLWLITIINRIFSDNDMIPFVKELNKLHQSLLNFDEVYDAYRFLETQLRYRILENNIDSSEVTTLCFQSEKNLAILLKKCSFLCAYQLVTIKDIGLVKSRREKNPKFIHNKAVLRGRDYDTLDNKPLARQSFTSNNSVIVTKDIKNESGQLNLSPFVIDQNAFKIGSNKSPKIYYFNGWLNEKNILYEHAEMLDEDFRVKENYDKTRYKDLDLLCNQFNQFRLDFNHQG